MTIGKSAFNSVIYGYTLNISKIGIKPFRLVVLLKALNAIYKATSLLILGSSTTIIW